MKKILIPLAIFFAIVIGGIIFAVSVNYSKVQYGKDTMFHVMDLSEGGTLTAEYNGTKTIVVGRNTQRVYSTLSVSDMNRLYKMPEWDESDAVYLHFSTGAEYIIAKDESVADGAYIIYEYNGKTKMFKLNGYRTMTWIKKAVSPSGIYGPNDVID